MRCCIFVLAFCTTFSFAKKSFSIDFDNNQFLKDGEPFRYISGSMHYFRIPEKYWEDRLLKFRAMGCNVLQSFVCWNWHEREKGQYDFSGGLNITKYFKLVKDLGMHVILRLGPYIDGEQDSGGFPVWLLKEKPDIKYRTSDPRYISAVQKWYEKLLPMVKPMLYPNGGPVIMVQVENEYGCYMVCDRNYTTWLRDLYKKHLGDDIVYFTVDNANIQKLQCTIPQVYPTIDFGPATLDQVKAHFQTQRSVATKGPLVNTEFWPGWFDLWGGQHETRSIESVVNTMTYMYQMNASFNIYNIHGGTNFGYNAGGETYPNGFGTITTSYDFDAPISEAGVLTPKYFAMRKTIERLTNKPIPFKIPSQPKLFDYGKIKFRYIGNIFQFLHFLSPSSIRSKYPLNAEDVGQYYGFLMYESQITSGKRLTIFGVHDRAYIFLNGALKSILQRPTTPNITLNNVKSGKLQILVENQGRICFVFRGVMTDHKGILNNITMDGNIIINWKIYALNFTKLAETIQLKPYKVMKIRKKALKKHKKEKYIPSIFVAEYEPKIVGDTFLDTTGWGKGQAFTGDGINIGRYWPSNGPQITLYHPFIKEGKNKLIMFELDKPNCFNLLHSCYAKLVNHTIYK